MSYWQVTIGSAILYDSRLEEYALPDLQLTQEVNKADSLRFTIFPDHPAYSAIVKFNPTVTVTRDGSIISKLRVLNETVGWTNEKVVTAEGPLAWLNDSIQRPFTFPTEESGSGPADYFRFLIERHNAQVPASRQLTVGNVTVTDPNGYISRSDSEYSTTFELLNEGLINTLGGYVMPRYEGGLVYLDYVSDSSTLSNQPVEFGLNMLSLDTERNGEDIATAILPLGKEDEDTHERLTIEELADSTTSDICKDGDIVYSAQAEALYGARITAVVTWDDVTLATNLLTRATAELAVRRQMPSTINITAADLSAAGYDYSSFRLGSYVTITDDVHEEHGLAAMYLIKKLTTDILNPARNSLKLGATTYSLTESNQRSLDAAIKNVENEIVSETAAAAREITAQYTSAIEQASDAITLSVSTNYFTKDEVDQKIGGVSSTITQTADEINIQFNSLLTEVNDNKQEADAKFASLSSYIQMAGGDITLGEVGNAVTLKIENDRIGIYHNGVAVTYWTADDFVSPVKLTIPVGGQLLIGNYAFIPRSNGSVDFIWVGA